MDEGKIRCREESSINILGPARMLEGWDDGVGASHEGVSGMDVSQQ